VPNVATETVTQACNDIVNLGFLCGSTTSVSSNLTSGEVVSTSPPAGSLQPKGTTINLNVSSGPSSVTVLNVIGETEATAESMLTGQGFNPVAQCTTTPPGSTTTTMPTPGTVVDQSPEGGVSATPGASVTIDVYETSC
jgi:serine/threonine-protein kinase